MCIRKNRIQNYVFLTLTMCAIVLFFILVWNSTQNYSLSDHTFIENQINSDTRNTIEKSFIKNAMNSVINMIKPHLSKKHLESFEAKLLKQIDEFLLTRQLSTITKVQKHLAIAHRYARSGMTLTEINHAYSLLNGLTGETTKQLSQHHKLTKTSSKKMFDVCPEIKLPKVFDYPLFSLGLSTANCRKHPFDSVVGFVTITSNCSTAKNIIEGINSNYGRVEMMVGVQSEDSCNDLISSYESSFKSLIVKSGMSDSGAQWKSLIKKTSTKYVLISRNVYSFDNQSNIERLVRIISATGVDAVGGAERFEDGRWSSGCYQMAMRNYTLRVIEGYDLSYNSCMYCDYLSGSFLSRRSTLLDKLVDDMTGQAVFVDYFLHLFLPDRIGAMNCIDVMFSSAYHDLNTEPTSMWQQVGRQWEINRFVMPNNKDIWFSCNEVAIKCHKTGGEVVPPCCLKELSDGLKFIFEVCKNNSIDCMIGGGTMVGSVKFYGVLPWERDEDMDFRAISRDKFENLRPIFESKEYSLSANYYKKYKSDLVSCVAAGASYCVLYQLNMKNWFIEMYGGGWLITDRRGKYRVPTQILFNGMWMNTYTNPAHSLRVEYGDDILQHVEHWGTLGRKSGWSNYTRMAFGSFMKCPRPNFHGCLSNFLPSGNIQFRDFWV